MKTNKLFFATLLIIILAIACQKEALVEPTEETFETLEKKLKSSTSFVDGSYELYQLNDFDPLWRFHKNGNSMQLETDPSITSWGSDYWGYWTDPFTLEDDSITYIAGGLTSTTYKFTVLQDGTIDVMKTVIVNPYLGGNPRVTISNPGTYRLIEDPGDDDPGDGDGDDNNDSTQTWTDISFENFENGLVEWKALGRDAGLYSGGTYAHQGAKSAYLKDNSGTQSSIQQNTFDASAYTELEISFWFYTISMESGEDFLIQFNNGNGTWVTIANYVSGNDFSNNQYYNEVLNLSATEYSFASNSRFRIMCNASDDNDYVLIDEILIRGLN